MKSVTSSLTEEVALSLGLDARRSSRLSRTRNRRQGISRKMLHSWSEGVNCVIAFDFEKLLKIDKSFEMSSSFEVLPRNVEK